MKQKKVPVLEGSAVADRLQLVESLRGELERLESVRWARDEMLCDSGCAALDRLLPGGGWRRGTLVEWLSSGWGSGAGMLALIVARQMALEGGVVVVLDRHRQFYPPAAAAWGLDLERLIVLRPRQVRDEIWALEQVLRCPGVAAAWAPLEHLDWRSFRRLQLAAESGGSLGLLLRPDRVRGQPSWAHLQFLVEPLPIGTRQDSGAVASEGGMRRLRVTRTRCRQATGQAAEARAAGMEGPADVEGPAGVEGLAGVEGPAGVEGDRRDERQVKGSGRKSVDLEMDETSGVIRSVSGRYETHPLHLAAQLADPTTTQRTPRTAVAGRRAL